MTEKIIRCCLLIVMLSVAGFAHAAAKSPEELCRERNAAKCDANGVQFNLTEQECPRGTKVLRKLGHENCDKLGYGVNAPAITPAASAVAKPPEHEMPVVAAVNEQDEVFYWSNLYFILTLIGLLQGMISRPSVGSFIIVMAVMPIIGTWSIVSDAHMVGGLLANSGYIGMELLGTFLFSMAGWAVGALIRVVAYKILL